MGNSGVNPQPATESRFVADEGPGFDVPHPIVSSGDVVSVFLETTRVVGTVDPDGLITGGGLLHPDQGTLARTLVLTIRAQIAAGLSGTLGSGVDVEVFLHRGITGPGVFVDSLEGTFGPDWQDFRLELPTLAVRWPADPCLGQDPSAPCGRAPVPRPNEISAL